MNPEFGELLRHYRKLKVLSQSQLQDRMDKQGFIYDKSAISKWETGLHVPPAEVVEILEDILLPKSNGLLLRAAGYLYEAESRFQLEYAREEQSPRSKELQTAALIIISNLEKYLNEPAAYLGTEMDRMGERVFGGWWIGEDRAKLGDVDREAAAELLKHLKDEGEFPELADIENWKDLNDTRITEDFIQRLISRAQRDNF
ncbi:helix-turn-helix domain-containing protein [Chloroflexota bacterium]